MPFTSQLMLCMHLAEDFCSLEFASLDRRIENVQLNTDTDVLLSAETFADNPAVIGYDILNEPYGDEVTEIGPLYEDTAKRIRKYDKKAILFIEPQVSPTSSSW